MKDTFITFGIFYRHLEKLNCLQGYSWDLSMGEGRSHYVTPILLLQTSCHTSCVLLKVTTCLMSNKWFMQYRFFGFTFFCYLIVRLYEVKFKINHLSKSPHLHPCSSICKAIFNFLIGCSNELFIFVRECISVYLCACLCLAACQLEFVWILPPFA